MRGRVFVLISLLVFGACQKQKTKSKHAVFFGGHVIQPTTNFLTLNQTNNSFSDTLLLNNNKRFEKQYDSLVSGIYSLEHLPEYQNVLLETGDSLWVRFNATDMAASLVYSGKGAAKNNFLMALKLDQERENRFLSTKYSLSSGAFNDLIDSLLLEKKKRWIVMDSLNNLSAVAQKITQAAYIYSYATIRERYALFRGSSWTPEEREIFFDFRRFLNQGDTDLAFFDPYVNYLLNYINNQALKQGKNYMQEKETTAFNIKRLDAVDENIKAGLLRNNLARAIAYEEILRFENHREHDLFLQYYATVNSSPEYFSEVLAFHNDLTRMQQGKKLPAVTLQSKTGEIFVSDTLWDNRYTVIYFWSQNKMNHYKGTLKKLEQLQKKFPHYRFVGICLQPFNEMVNQVQQLMEITPEDQFAVLDYEDASQAWMLTLLNKAIILKPNGIIYEGFGNFLDPQFETLLKQM